MEIVTFCAKPMAAAAIEGFAPVAISVRVVLALHEKPLATVMLPPGDTAVPRASALIVTLFKSKKPISVPGFAKVSVLMVAVVPEK